MMWLTPRLIPSTTSGETSISKTERPAFANVCASGTPT